MENFWINFFIEIVGKDKVYNKMINNEHNHDSIMKMSIQQSGSNNGFYGKTHTQETKQKLSQHFTGQKLSEETKQKISQSVKGENHPNCGKKYSDISKLKMSEARKGKYQQQNSPHFKRGSITISKENCYKFQYYQNGKKQTKSFSINKYGKDEAYRLIVEFQNQIYPIENLYMKKLLLKFYIYFN